jgi:hypothetical protein
MPYNFTGAVKAVSAWGDLAHRFENRGKHYGQKGPRGWIRDWAAEDVGRLISTGHIPAKHLIARGTGKRPRLRVLQSVLTAFIAAMPDAVAPVDEAREPPN